ncbi:dihydrodipicolinate synthase family protein [Halopelagius fulvigenes]|uniref:Dihydrodipicolinate synthase family protein n=1 Tax=Halopelagius fulvigenes TaxID=1198324 RepID=A0ABD5TTQ0_9EURY
MHGTGPPLATPFEEDGTLDERALRELVRWVEARGVDFIAPCGSSSEAEFMSAEERARVIEIVVSESDVPVLAGTGHPGYEETVRATADAAAAGADAALVVTPFYYPHDEDELEAYYRDVADEADIPVYLYSVPTHTGVALSPELVGRLASYPNIAGMKDSSGDIDRFIRERRATRDDDFDLLVGAGGVFAQALGAGADGGVLGLANVAPEAAVEVYERHRDGDEKVARRLNASLVDLNRAVTDRFGVPGLKAAMRARGAPAGTVRRPLRPVSEDVRSHLEELAVAAGRDADD